MTVQRFGNTEYWVQNDYDETHQQMKQLYDQ